VSQRFFLLDFGFEPTGCCYYLVDFETHAPENGIFLTQQMCHIMILFDNGCTIKDGSNQKCHSLSISKISFPHKGKAYKIKIRFSVYAF